MSFFSGDGKQLLHCLQHLHRYKFCFMGKKAFIMQRMWMLASPVSVILR